MDKEQLEALLGRTLTDEEVTNLTLYLNIASERLETLLCSTFEDVSETRKYESREGYSTVFVDIFNEATQVKIDGIVSTDYEVRQFDNLNGIWYNSLVFKKRFYKTQIVELTADYGFAVMPEDLNLLLAQLFNMVSEEQSTDNRVRSQRIDDAQVTFSGDSIQQQFYKDNASIINKYSICSVGLIRQGKINRCW